MVLLTSVLAFAVKKLPRKYLRKGFIDTLRLHVKGGNGGSGLPRYGGVGGSGGNVIFVGTEDITLRNVMTRHSTRKVAANPGYNSEMKGILGRPGEDIEIKVPTGVTLHDPNGALLGEINKPDAKLVVAKGGLGGCPETGFSGQKGQNLVVTLDFKLVADVALVGFPNAGKSTLLRAVSNAKPKIAAYPFTTIRPQLGIIKYPDFRNISIADLPGLIEGAHANIGMGHKFLKHLNRTKLMVFIVDVQGFQLSAKYFARSCLQTIVLLNKEIELYNPDLIDMKAILIINKMDTENAEKKFKEIESALLNLSSIFDDFPSEIRPERAVQFEDVLTTSLILKKDDEINLIKEKIRYYFDKQAEALNNNASAEIELFKKLNQELKVHSPIVV